MVKFRLFLTSSEFAFVVEYEESISPVTSASASPVLKPADALMLTPLLKELLVVVIAVYLKNQSA